MDKWSAGFVPSSGFIEDIWIGFTKIDHAQFRGLNKIYYLVRNRCHSFEPVGSDDVKSQARKNRLDYKLIEVIRITARSGSFVANRPDHEALHFSLLQRHGF